MQLSSRILSISCLLAVTLPTATAQGFYVEGNVGIDQPDYFSFGGSNNDLDIPTIGATAGYAINKHWAIEGDLRFGLQNDDTYLDSLSGNGEVGLNVAGGAFVRASIPIVDRLSAHLRLGASFSEYKSSIPRFSASQEADSFNGAALGAGGTFALTEDVYVRTDYTIFERPGVDSGAFTLGAGLKF